MRHSSPLNSGGAHPSRVWFPNRSDYLHLLYTLIGRDVYTAHVGVKSGRKKIVGLGVKSLKAKPMFANDTVAIKE